MKNLEDLEKKINSELTTKINKTEIKHNQIYIETDKDDFVNWMKLDSSILYIKIYSENAYASSSDVTTGTQSWVQAIGGDFTVNNTNHAGSGGWRSMGGTLANDQLHRFFNDIKLGVNTPGKGITSVTNGIPMFCGSNSHTLSLIHI